MALLSNELTSRADKTHNRLIAFDGGLGNHRPIVNQTPVFSSADKNCRGFLLELHRVAGQANYDVQAPYTLVGLHLGQPTRVEVKGDGPFEEKIFHPGDIALIPSGAKHSIRFEDPAEFMIMSLDPDLIAQANRTIRGKDSSELPVLWCHRDLFIRETFHNIRASLEESLQIDRTYAETLATALAMHIVRNCSQSNGPSHPRSVRGLSRSQLTKTIEFIRNTPYREISLKTMSAAAGLSPFHFARMFKLSTGISPHQFVLKRRLDMGAEMLTTSNDAISNIATVLGFADQSHFTMHFKKMQGVAPAAYRRQKRR